MIPHDFLTMYWVKAAEYLIALAFLLFFIPFWHYVNAERMVRREAAAETSRWLRQITNWFLLPEQLYFHLGHAWVSVENGDVVTVGVDDFAQKLAGRVSAILLPQVGSQVGQGEKAWSLVWTGKSVDMFSPVDGTVVAINEEIISSPEKLLTDPYGEGWLMKVKTPRLKANSRQLLSGPTARHWMEGEADKLQAMVTPDLGRLYQDGGLPIHGMARALDPERWDEIIRSFFLAL